MNALVPALLSLWTKRRSGLKTRFEPIMRRSTAEVKYRLPDSGTHR